MKQQKYFLDYESIRFIFSQVFSVDESEVIFSIFYLFLLLIKKETALPVTTGGDYCLVILRRRLRI